jgi:hypothetical protein
MTPENGFFTTEAQRTQRTTTKKNIADSLNSREFTFDIIGKNGWDVERQFASCE